MIGAAVSSIAGLLVKSPRTTLTVGAALLCALLAGGVAWKVQTWRCDARVAAIEKAHDAQLAAIKEAADKQAADNLKKERTHAKDTLANAETLVAELRARAATADARAAAAERLRTDAVRREASTRAWASSLDTARGDLADRLVALEGHLERGVGVVGRCNSALERRDAEVATLARQVRNERALTEGER